MSQDLIRIPFHEGNTLRAQNVKIICNTLKMLRFVMGIVQIPAVNMIGGATKGVCAMFSIIEPNQFHEKSDILNQMYELRAKVFSSKLGWSVTVKDGREEDAYDLQGPSYLVLTNSTDTELIASARLLPSTGPTLLTDVFHETLPAGREFFSPAIWEITRFCIDDDRAVEHFGSAAAFHAAKLMFLTFGDFALSNGIDTLLATIDVRMLRLIRRAGITLDVLESTASFGTHRVYSVLFPVSVEGRHKLRQAFGVTGNVFDLKRPFDTAGPSHVPASAAA